MMGWLKKRKIKAEAKASMDFYAKIMDLTLMWIEENGHLKAYQEWLDKNHGLKMGVTHQEKK